MANSTKTVKYGNYICNVGNFDIYMKCSYNAADSAGRVSVKSHQHCIYMGKKLVKNGFKTKTEAISYIENLPKDFKNPSKNRK